VQPENDLGELTTVNDGERLLWLDQSGSIYEYIETDKSWKFVEQFKIRIDDDKTDPIAEDATPRAVLGL
jgi:hypothetical protein